EHEIASAYAALDVMVHASTQPEPFGRTAIEAMAAGVPVVAAAGGGISEVIEDGLSGLLTPPGDAGALARALADLHARPELRAALSAQGLARVRQRFTEEMVAQMVVLAALARRYRRQPPSAGRQRALAIKLVGMGDAVLMLSALAALRRAGFHLTVLTTRRCAQVFTAPGIADEVIVARGFAAWRPIWQAARHADAIFDFEQHVYWSAAVALLAPRARRHGFRTRSRRRNLAYHVLVDPGATPRP